MDDLNLRFSTDSDRSGETGETEAPPLEEKTERASDEPTTATDAAPAMSPDEAGCQHPVADPPTLVTLEEKSESGLPVEAPSTTPLAGSATNKRRPHVDLLEHQLVMSVTRNSPKERASRLVKGTFDLYSSLAPEDAIDSMLAGAMVGLLNAIMDCFDRANWSGRARELNLRYGIKGAATLAALTKLYDSRRGQGRQTVTVGKVNVEAGGQAIVGNVDSGDRRKRATKSKSTRSPWPQRATPKRRQG